MTRLFCFIGLGTVLFFTACDNSDRIAQLEKQNKELEEKLNKENVVAEYDLAAKCSKDAKAWFSEHWHPDKGTKLLDFTNHYNKKENKCFIVVEYHYNSDLNPYGTSWTNDLSLWDIYENSQFGDFDENHYTDNVPKFNIRKEVVTCKVSGQECKSVDEFDNLVRPFMND